MPVFKPISRGGHLPDLIAAEIMERVSSGELAPGDRLPPEHVLAESFGVSRNVVREAISRLRSDGVVETKPRLGARILPPSQRTSFRIDPDLAKDREELESLFELRGILEIEAAGLAADRRSPEDIAEIEGAVRAMEGRTIGDELWLDADGVFHRALARASRNDYLASIVDYLAVRIIESTRMAREVYSDDDLLELTVNEHRAILAAIEAQDVAAARQAMYDHLSGAAERVNVAFSGRH